MVRKRSELASYVWRGNAKHEPAARQELVNVLHDTFFVDEWLVERERGGAEVDGGVADHVPSIVYADRPAVVESWERTEILHNAVLPEKGMVNQMAARAKRRQRNL